MTLGQLLRWGREELRHAGIGEWELDAWYLLEHAAGCTRNEYFLGISREVPASQERRYQELIARRGTHVPLQYLTGSQGFMGLSFRVDEQVLIPRQDTEVLVETALSFLEEGMRILDLCTGSGCVLLSLLKLGRRLTGVGVDISSGALKVAEQNCRELDVRATLLESDLFSRVSGRFDRIVSNPPYIPSQVVDTLMEEVREHEPRVALDGGEDGLYYYRRIVEQAPAYLAPGGMLFFEVGHDQAEAVCACMEKDFTGIAVGKDLSGLDRVVYGTRR